MSLSIETTRSIYFQRWGYWKNHLSHKIHEKFVFGRHERATRVTYCHIISLRRLHDILHDKNTRRYNCVCHKNWTTVFIKIVIKGD